MPSTTSIESTSYTLKLNANSEKVLNRITNWTKISNASRNQMPVAAFAWPSSGESVAVRAGTGRWSAYRRHRYGGRCCVLPWCSWLLAGTRVCCRRCRRTDVGMPWFLYCWECIFASLLVEWSFTAELSRRESVWLSTVVRCRWPKEVNRFGCDTLIPCRITRHGNFPRNATHTNDVFVFSSHATHTNDVFVFSSPAFSAPSPRFAVAGQRVGNSLPTELKPTDSLGQFKRRLKTHLFGLWNHSA